MLGVVCLTMYSHFFRCSLYVTQDAPLRLSPDEIWSLTLFHSLSWSTVFSREEVKYLHAYWLILGRSFLGVSIIIIILTCSCSQKKLSHTSLSLSLSSPHFSISFQYQSNSQMLCCNPLTYDSTEKYDHYRRCCFFSRSLR